MAKSVSNNRQKDIARVLRDKGRLNKDRLKSAKNIPDAVRRGRVDRGGGGITEKTGNGKDVRS